MGTKTDTYRGVATVRGSCKAWRKDSHRWEWCWLSDSRRAALHHCAFHCSSQTPGWQGRSVTRAQPLLSIAPSALTQSSMTKWLYQCLIMWIAPQRHAKNGTNSTTLNISPHHYFFLVGEWMLQYDLHATWLQILNKLLLNGCGYLHNLWYKICLLFKLHFIVINSRDKVL